LAFVRSPTQEPSRIISCLFPARGLPGHILCGDLIGVIVFIALSQVLLDPHE
jgi:hypothetical protein